jgi:SOS-response transcriptional repressor LexA
MQAAEAAAEAATGSRPVAPERESGFEAERIRAYLEQNAAAIDATGLEPAVAQRLRELAASVAEAHLEDLDRTLTVLEEKMFAGLVASAPEEELTALREQAARELAPYRGKMQAVQIKQVQQQFLQKRLLEAKKLPRLSLFYMPHG